MAARVSDEQHRNFMDVFRTLPRGGLPGTAGPALAIAETDDNFVGPTLRVVEASMAPNVTLVSARGATGKSALARRLSSLAKAPLWDLSSDRGVSGDALAGRLNEYLGADGLSRFLASDDGFLIVDALDEARMRVSAQSWTEFLDSLATAAEGGHRFVLLGRERILDDVWIHLDDRGRNCAWFEISHFDRNQRVEYVDRYFKSAGKEPNEVYEQARDAVLSALEGTVDSSHAESFVGYAPVLDAVVALLVRENPMRVINTFSDEVAAKDRIDVLQTILERLLLREQEKIAPLAAELELQAAAAYTPEEQTAWLASELLGADVPELGWCPPEKRGEYAKRIGEFLRDHPFRAEAKWASPVFGASIASRVFGDIRVRGALAAVGRRTGLLFDFVLNAGSASDLDEWQFAALHESMLAAEWQDVTAEVAVSREEASESVEELNGQLYLAEGPGARGADFALTLERVGELRILGPTAFMSVVFPGGRVVVEALNGSSTLGPDLYISAADVEVAGEAVEVGRRPPQGGPEQGPDASVVIEAEDELQMPPNIVGAIPPEALELRVGSDINLTYPWVDHRQTLVPLATAADERARRFLNMLMALLRRHGHDGPMAVFDKKLQGRQSIRQGEFTSVIHRLESMGVVRYDASMIFFEPSWEPRWFDYKGRPGLPSLEDNAEAWNPVLEAISDELAS